MPRPPDWLRHVNTPRTEAEVEALRENLRRQHPFGDDAWMAATAERLGLEASLRPQGRIFGRVSCEETSFPEAETEPMPGTRGPHGHRHHT